MSEPSVYDELALDLMALCAVPLSLEQAKEVVSFLKSEGHIDFDALKEYYDDEA